MRYKVILVILIVLWWGYTLVRPSCIQGERVLHWGTLSPFPKEFNPIFVSTGGGVTITRLVFDPLFDVVGDKYMPNLVDHWEVLDRGHFRFHLRKGVLFHDGKEMTANDVIFSFRLLKKAAKGRCVIERRLSQIKDMVMVDKYTFDVLWSQGLMPTLFSVLTFPVLPKHLYGNDSQKDYVKYHPIGTGPYIFKGFISPHVVLLERNSRYFQGMPSIDKIELTSYQSKLELFNALLRGQVDLALFMPASTYRAISHLRRVRVLRQILDYYYAVIYDLNDPAFADKRVRKAIAMVVDWKKFSSLPGFGRKAEGPFRLRYFQKDGYTITYSPQKAIRLLEAAGWQRKNGFWQKSGEPLEIRLYVPNVYTYDQRWLMLLRQELNRFGIRLILKRNKNNANAYLVMMYGGDNIPEVIFWWSLIGCKDRIISGLHFLPQHVSKMLEKALQGKGDIKLLRNVYRALYYNQVVWFLFYPIVYHVISNDLVCRQGDCSLLELNAKQGILSMYWRKLKGRR